MTKIEAAQKTLDEAKAKLADLQAQFDAQTTAREAGDATEASRIFREMRTAKRAVEDAEKELANEIAWEKQVASKATANL